MGGKSYWRIGVASAILALACVRPACAQTELLFNRDIRPILSDSCFPCHGPDAKNRQAELRLDLADSALAARDGKRAIVPGEPERSELIRRITSTDPDQKMPPPGSGHALSAAEIEILRKWIASGAKWQKHWSLIPPVRPAIPAHMAHTPLDAFIQARLAKEQLQPSPSADKPTLLRRAACDLTGLPPTPQEVVAFENNPAPDAYEQEIDRLFASPRYGERMAGPWLDAARYADTSGYQSDGERFMWRWRDWVIAAYNRGMPFDQFTIEQIAGDLLPQATLEQKIATGFHRNHRGNAEGGIIPEEYAAEYVADRVETTGTVWLGLTIGCARCHDHKFDPLPTREFYQLAAFFNNVPEKGRAVKFGNSPPFIAAPTEWQQRELAGLEQRLLTARAKWKALQSRLDREQADWERTASADLPKHFWPDRALVKQWPLADRPLVAAPVLDSGDIADFGYFDKFTLSAWVWLTAGNADEQVGGTIISRMTDVPEGDGYQFAIVKGKLQLNLVKRWLDDSTRVQTAEAVPLGRWVHVAATYDGSRTAAGIQLYLDGRRRDPEVLLDELNQPFNAKQPLRIGGGGGPAATFRGQLKDARVEAADLAPEEIAWLATAESLAQIRDRSWLNRTPAQARKIREYYLSQAASDPIRAAHQELQTAERKLKAFHESLPTVMVMEELKQPRPTHILLRGQYDQPRERVTYNVPAAIAGLAKSAPRNRLGLAQWLVNTENPLTARVQVNRLWQLHFGVGLVKTAEDFGSQGEWPSHPELLDFYAVEWPAHAWDVKWLQRQLLTSSTYRQQSRATHQQLERDPENRLLARGPRQRLSAEQIRDQALFVSGLLVEEIGGPSVKPLQPPGLWKELTGAADYEPGSGADLYRRSLYTFWKRTIAPPNMTALDAPSREFCTVRSSRTNTPLQALTLLNETTFAGAAEALAAKTLARKDKSDEARIAWAFQACTSRPPAAAELEILHRGLKRQRALNPGQEVAAYTAVMRVLFNLDETLHKN